MDEMTRALSELSQSHDVVERTGHDEVWMLPSKTSSEKKSVTIVEPTTVIFNKEECSKAKEAAQMERGVVEQEELVLPLGGIGPEMTRNSICLTVLFVVLVNCTVALAMTLYWATFFM